MSVLPLLKYSSRQALKSIPGVLEVRLLARKRLRHRLVTASTSVCIEAFPRSGTGYAVALANVGLQLPQGAIASNTHSIANIRRAVARQVPAFVLIRDALQSCLSLMVWGDCSDLVDALRAYHRFYAGLLPMVDGVTVVPFEALIESPNRVFDQLARSLKMDVSWSDGVANAVTQARTRRDFSGRERIALRANVPNATKEKWKDALLKQHFTAEAEQWYVQCQRLRTHLIAAAPNKIEAHSPSSAPSSAACRAY